MNDCQKMVNRIFICLVIVVLAIFLTGCSTTKWEWFPQDLPLDKTDPHSLQSKWAKEEKEAGIVRFNLIKASF